MSELSWNATKKHVYERAKGCCEYCQTCEANIGQPMHVEHIDSEGGDGLENLCLSCANCNLSKATATYATDPDTQITVMLFNPRLDHWKEHFEWDKTGVILNGLTSVGRATIARLKINQERMLIARRRWVVGGFHPLDE